jgi:predicted phage terminase large subunit-like protein
LLFFTRYIFKEVYGKKFVVNAHHLMIADALKRVESGEYPNLVINIPPRMGKTEIVVKMWFAYTFAKNPQAQFIHTSFSDDLALDNSGTVREIIQSEAFQRFWPMQVRGDTSSKKLWRIEGGGGVRSAASGGAITGFGAGVMGYKHGDLFSGACVVDDPLKPDDGFSKTERDKVNNRLRNTLKSRRNSPHVPIVIVMQRLHQDDASGFVLSGAMGIDFHILKIAALSESGESIWPLMITADELKRMKETDRYTFASQYQQEPTPSEGGIVKMQWFKRYRVKPASFDKIVFSWDTASKGAEHNDPSVCTVWGVAHNLYYLLDVYRERVEYPALTRAAYNMAAKWEPDTVLIEDKSSGQALIQDLRNETAQPVIAIMPEGDKLARMMRVSSAIEAGACYLPETAPWLIDFENELASFPNGSHDDQVDSVSQFLTHMKERAYAATPSIRRIR